MVLAEDELGVDEDITGEDEGREAAVDQLARTGARQEHHHEAEEHEPPERAEQVRHPRREVVLGLAREEGQENEDAAGEDGCVQHDLCLVERDDDADGVGFEESKSGEEEQVCWVRLALPVRQEHETDRSDEL